MEDVKEKGGPETALCMDRPSCYFLGGSMRSISPSAKTAFAT